MKPLFSRMERSILNKSNLQRTRMIFLIYPEAFGLSGIEAMMNNKPVVGSMLERFYLSLKIMKRDF